MERESNWVEERMTIISQRWWKTTLEEKVEGGLAATRVSACGPPILTLIVRFGRISATVFWVCINYLC